MEFIETHAHLCDEKFNADRAETIEKIYSSGISRIIEVSCTQAEWPAALSLARKYPGKMFCAFGIHPEYSETITAEQKEELKKYLALPETVALGEIGTDYWWETGTPESQKKLLSEQLALCPQSDRPAIFHSRNGRKPEQNAYKDLLDVVHEWNYSPERRFRGVLHCFSGTAEDAKKALAEGLALGVGGTFTYKRNGALRDIIKSAGADNIVLETDCPYLPPEGWRGKRNDSSFIPEIAVFVASYLEMSTGRLAEITNHNVAELFGI